MNRSTRRLLLFGLALIPTILLLGWLYQWGMLFLEDDPRTYQESLMTVVETLTTTGYGSDSSWSHPLMTLFMIGLQVFGVLIFFLIFPIYLLPFMEERFESRLPTHAGAIQDHILIYNYGPAVATLIEELDTAEVPVVIVEESESEARVLYEQGYKVVHRPTEEGVLDDRALEAASLLTARAMIANGRDDQNADAILAARQMGFSREILSFVEEANHRAPLLLAGATEVYSPRQILGTSLAALASQKISPTLAGVHHIGKKLEIWEIRVQPGSPLAGKTLAEVRLGPGTGATIIALWVGGSLIASPMSTTRIEPHNIIVAMGGRSSMERLRELAGPARPLLREGPFVVAGYGEVGQKVVELLHEAGEETRVWDRIRLPGVDLVGNVLDPDLLKQANVEDAQGIILALDTDAATEFATVILRNLAPTVLIVARVNRAENITKIHRAGADYALSMSGIAGQMLARRLLGQESISVDPMLKILKVSAEGLAGYGLADVNVRRRTGASVVAVERGDEVQVQFAEDFVFRPNDAVYICGDGESLKKFLEVFPQSDVAGSRAGA